MFNRTRLAKAGTAKGFTLIELLIVVAIIAILAAIAVPNFLEAQTRSKVSRALSDIRSMRTALESYAVDNNRYPETDQGITAYTTNRRISIDRITTPIAYMTTIPRSPFTEKFGSSGAAAAKLATLRNHVLYVSKIDNYALPESNDLRFNPDYESDRLAYYPPVGALNPAQLKDWRRKGDWLIKSVGPDNIDDRDSVANGGFGPGARVYDATNGTVSRGDIVVVSDRSGDGK
jgi:type II secretion system protein G